ncbi:hypothetical protein [uncultured Clostridium sp.]|uniref:hypothetical protein n=1 Tax=uncultured Clostridium sp. TaxID=59620 RepID=UPI00265DD1EB|nr:hypothetical protein [uncultured Clostridium sp.]
MTKWVGTGLFSESIGIFHAAGVSGLYQPVFVYYPPDEPESEIGKNLSGERNSFARIRISGILRKTEYAKMECRNGGKLCSGIIVFFCLKILFLAWTASFF